jgi:hypothetical protein
MTWDRRLSRPITLSDGRTRATLHNAADCLIATFDGISHWPALEHARDLLSDKRPHLAGSSFEAP